MTSPSDISDYIWLTSEAARPWLLQAASEAATTSPVVLAKRLRRDLSTPRARLVLEQVALRKRGREKFALADEMFFSPVALEQATDETMARYKAARFPATAELADLCCGIGGDSIGLALRGGRVRGIDRQPVHGLFAMANVRRYLEAAGLPAQAFSVDATDVREFDWQGGAWHADPDRRAMGRRTTAIEAHDPPREVLDQWRARQPAAAIKLAPATQLPDPWQREAESEWISHRGECRQLVAWFGGLAARPGERVATKLIAGQPPQSIAAAGTAPPPYVDRIGRFVYEPDPAVLAARLVGALAVRHQLHTFAVNLPYLTGDHSLADPLLAGFEVIDVLPFRLKQLTAYCRQHNIGQVEVKKRGVECDPASVQRQLAGAGSAAATILIARRDTKAIAIVARRVAAASSSEGGSGEAFSD